MKIVKFGIAARALGKVGAEAKTRSQSYGIAQGKRGGLMQSPPMHSQPWGKMGPEAKSAADAITELFKVNDESARDAAIETLEKVGPAAIPALRERLKEKDFQTRTAAIETLGKLGPAAVPALREVLNSGDLDAQQAAIEALGKIGPEAKVAIGDITGWLKGKAWPAPAIVSTVLHQIGPAAVPVLVELLKDKDFQVRSIAAETLGNIGPGAKAAIPAAHEPTPPRGRVYIVGSRGIGEDRRGRGPGIDGVAKDRGGLVRTYAAQALGEIGIEAKAAIPVPHGIAQGHRPWGSAGRRRALGEIGPDAAVATAAAGGVAQRRLWVGPLRRRQSTGENRVRGQDRHSGPRQMLQDEDGQVHGGRRRGPGEDGPAAVPALMELLRDKAAWRSVWSVLGRIGPEAKTAIPTLITMLNDKEEHVRQAAALALWEVDRDAFGSEPTVAVRAFTGSLKDDDGGVRQAAAMGAREDGSRRQDGHPGACGIAFRQGVDGPVRGCRELGRDGGEANAAAPALGDLLKDEDSLSAGCRQGIGTNGAAEAKAAVPALTELLLVGDGHVRQDAAKVLEASVPRRRQPFQPSRNCLGTPMRTGHAAGKALAKIGLAAVPALTASLEDRDSNVRQEAAKGLAEIGLEAKAAIPALTKMLEGPTWRIKGPPPLPW